MIAPAPPGARPGDDVQVWHARITDFVSDRARITRALDWLAPDERARHDRFRGDADRAMFLVGRVMARTLVGRGLGLTPTAWTWREGPRGRPEVGEAASAISFNLAHSGGIVACALRRGGGVGIDVEDRNRRALDARLVERYCAPDEIADIQGRGPEGWRDQFLKYWTLKEAYLKARGLGIAVPLADLSFRLEPGPVRLTCLNSLAGESTDWTFALDELPDRVFLAVAAPLGTAEPPQVVVSRFPDEWWP
jgi:4'-phosphopantetheinyl transferase